MKIVNIQKKSWRTINGFILKIRIFRTRTSKDSKNSGVFLDVPEFWDMGAHIGKDKDPSKNIRIFQTSKDSKNSGVFLEVHIDKGKDPSKKIRIFLTSKDSKNSGFFYTTYGLILKIPVFGRLSL